MVHSTEKTCGRTKGPRRHKETWWWNSEVQEAVDRKSKSFQNWLDSRREEDLQLYKEHRKAASKAVAVAKASKQIEFAEHVETKEGRDNIFRIAKQLAQDKKDVTGMRCLKGEDGVMRTQNEDILKIWKTYMEKLANEEHPYSKESLDEASGKQGCCVKLTVSEVESALKCMKDVRRRADQN